MLPMSNSAGLLTLLNPGNDQMLKKSQAEGDERCCIVTAFLKVRLANGVVAGSQNPQEGATNEAVPAPQQQWQG